MPALTLRYKGFFRHRCLRSILSTRKNGKTARRSCGRGKKNDRRVASYGRIGSRASTLNEHRSSVAEGISTTTEKEEGAGVLAIGLTRKQEM